MIAKCQYFTETQRNLIPFKHQANILYLLCKNQFDKQIENLNSQIQKVL